MLRELYRLRVVADPGREALRFSGHTVTHGDLLPQIDRWQELVTAAAARCGCSDPDLIWAIHGGDTIDNLLLGLSQVFSGRALLLLPLHATEAERATLVRRAGVGVVLSDRPLSPSMGLHRRTTVAQGWEIWAPLAGSPEPAWQAPDRLLSLADVAQEARVRLERAAGLALSSGTTTGVPAIQRSSFLEWLAMQQHPEWPPSRRMLMSFRMQFGASRAWASRILLEGATLCCVRVSERQDLPELAGLLEADTLSVNPPYIETMLAERLERRFPASLGFVTGTDRVPGGAAALSWSLRRPSDDRLGQQPPRSAHVAAGRPASGP